MLLEVEGLDVFYSKMQVIRNAFIKVERGEIVIIAGSNGAGKSTLLKTVCGLITPKKGSIFFKDDRIDGLSTNRVAALGISLIPEGGRVFPGMTVSDNLDLGGYLVKTAEKKVERLKWVYQFFPVLQERKRQIAKTLSGGQRQMLAIAIGLMSHPELLLIDEPSSGLAPKLVKELLKLISDIRDIGLTVLLVEQNVRAALGIADRGYVLENGKIVLRGTNEELKNNEHVQRAYLGT